MGTSSDKSSTISTPETNGFVSQTTVIKEKLKSYKKYTSEELRECILGWVLQKNKTDMKTYCMSTNVPRTTLNTYMINIPQLLTMRKLGGNSLEEVELVLDHYLKKQKNIKTKQLEELRQNKLYLSEDEEGLLTNVALLLSHIGHGICREELLHLVNIILHEKKDKRLTVPATMKTVDGMLSRSDTLKKQVKSASSLHPCRAAQASQETRDSMFTKLENYIVLLHELGLSKYKSYCDVPGSSIYNMDECAIDTTKRKKNTMFKRRHCKTLSNNTRRRW